jgi:hypothetical protein
VRGASLEAKESATPDAQHAETSATENSACTAGHTELGYKGWPGILPPSRSVYRRLPTGIDSPAGIHTRKESGLPCWDLNTANCMQDYWISSWSPTMYTSPVYNEGQAGCTSAP